MNVLLVEDNPDDIAAVARVAAASRASIVLTVVKDGQDAADYLFRQGGHAGRRGEAPDFVLLDISLPRVSGFEVLRRMKEDTRLRDVPVIMLTASDADAQVREALDLGAHSYVVKPLRAEGFSWMARSFCRYQTRIASIADIAA